MTPVLCGSGSYNNPATGSGYELFNGQSVFGRTSDFSQLATGDSRPAVNDSVVLNGNNNLYNLRITGHSIRTLDASGSMSPFLVGLLTSTTSSGVNNVYNTDITANSSSNSVITVANTANASSFNIYNSTITCSISNVAGGVSVGVGNLTSGAMNINKSSITVSSSDIANNNSLAFGFVNNQSGLVTITNSSISASLNHGLLVSGVLNNSTDGLGLGTITMTGSAITVNANDANLAVAVLNQANNGGGISANININNSTISSTSNNNGGGTVVGVLSSGTGIANINNSAINATGDSGGISGIVVGSPTATVNFQNTVISLDVSGTATGAPTQNAGTLNDNGGNQCFQNGLAVPC